MANEITANGLTVKTLPELVAEFTAAMQAIYGTDINLASNSPDGQMMMIFLQAVIDNLDLLTQINSGFDPDQAFGKTLDMRVSYNGIQRQAGTPTVTDIEITRDRSLTLLGINTNPDDPFTVADNAGNNWQLQTTVSLVGAGTSSLGFQSAVDGAVLTTPNTITVPVSVVLGVTAINNPTTYTTLGIDEESDALLRIRRQKAVSLASQGYLAPLIAALENVTDVGNVYVYENNTSGVDGNGVPGHSIWVIVSGTASAADIADAIYKKRSAGCGMKGITSHIVTQVDGSPFIVYWDVVTPEDLYINMEVESIDGVNPVDIAAIRSGLVTLFVPGVYQEININALATVVQQIDPNCLVSTAGFCKTVSGSYTKTLTPTNRNNQFAVASARIHITPMILSPSVVTLGTTETQQFTPLGGRAPYTYSMFANPSGGSVDVAGLYTAGATPGVDVVRVTDADAHTADASVTVT